MSENTQTGGVTQVGATVMWGTDANETYGMIQSINRGKGGQTREYKDYNGDTRTLVVYDKHDTISFSAILKSGATLPEIGSSVTLNLNGESLTVYVTSASIDYANEDATKISVSGRTYPMLGSTSS